MRTLTFPLDFLFGVATSAYQIEGGYQADGKGLSIWDEFCRQGKIRDQSNGEIACDHYHRWSEDVAWMARLGVKAYRFSISWPRIFPEGQGRFNQPGMDFYKRLIDALLAQDIQPWVTLYHWDLPLALQKNGGWENRDNAFYFGEYAHRVGRELQDRVSYWATINEPATIVGHGYLKGDHAPGRQSLIAAYQVAHHLLLAHAAGQSALRACSPGFQIGLCLNFYPLYAVNQPSMLQAGGWHNLCNRFFLDPIYFGHYPGIWHTAMHCFYGKQLEQDLCSIQQPIDFLGVNYYTRIVVRGSGPITSWLVVPRPHPSAAHATDMGWEIFPRGLEDTLEWLQQEYNHDLNLYVTENGAAFKDRKTSQGIEDKRRIDFLQQHVQSLYQAYQRGIKVKGYFVWSLLDNFEWSHGLSRRFGLLYVDYAQLTRSLKESAHWYAQLCRTKTLLLEESESGH